MAFLSKYGVARHIYIPMVKRAVVDHAVSADWTPAAGDVKISKDGGAAANVTNLPVAIAMGNSTIWDFSITATEMQAAQVMVTIGDSATKAVEDSAFIIETYGNASGQHAVDLADSVRAGLTALPNATVSTVGGLPVAVDTSGRVDVLKINGTSQTARDLGASVLLSAGTGTGQLDFTSGVVKANLAQILGTALTETAGQIAAAFKKVFDVASATFTALSVNQTGDSYARIGAPVGASISADVAAVKALLPTALVGGRMDSSVGAVASNAITAAAIADGAIDRATFAADTGLQSTRSNTAQAGAGSTITLDASASAVDSFYKGMSIVLTGATGAGQVREITGYVGSTKVATVSPAWATNPDNTTTFAVMPYGPADVEAWLGATAPAMTGDAYARLGAPAGASVSADVAAVKVDTAAVKVQTDKLTFTVSNKIDANVLDWKSSTAPAMTGDAYARLGAPAGASVSADIAALPTASVVKAQAVAALNTDTYAEPGQGAPAATATLAAKINYLYKAWRNKKTQTSSTLSLYADDTTTVDQKATVSDDGTTFTSGEIATGP